ncbi:hypothetical protein [Candidatus Borrarchaeum sp.]|uniref:hypothetical protein n=1 Tax=Candidatus Borrarchaeum sp. TaxID=2846742 RepID=UPI00257C045F|nr:hypothetical protein [Candidatus Borrarchaeum sp.]
MVKKVVSKLRYLVGVAFLFIASGMIWSLGGWIANAVGANLWVTKAKDYLLQYFTTSSENIVGNLLYLGFPYIAILVVAAVFILLSIALLGFPTIKRVIGK